MDERPLTHGSPEHSVRSRKIRPPQHPVVLARLLHAIAGAAHLTTAFVPILRSAPSSSGPQLIWTSLGAMDSTPYPHPTAVLLAIGVLVVAVVGSAAPVNRVCIAVVTVVGALMLALLLIMIVDPPSLLWDGVDAEGRPTGGMVVGRPYVGALLAGATGLLLIVGGQCGLIARARRPGGPPLPSATRTGPPAP